MIRRAGFKFLKMNISRDIGSKHKGIRCNQSGSGSQWRAVEYCRTDKQEYRDDEWSDTGISQWNRTRSEGSGWFKQDDGEVEKSDITV